MRKQTKATLLLSAILGIAVAALFLASQARQDDGDAAAVESPTEENALIREDSRILGEEGTTGVEFVEFLDFECEACGAAFPIVEDLRDEYAGEVTFVIRYFPLPGHFNSERAARAVESAARQGKLEEMYAKMYETQASWGEAQEPRDDLFRTFAEELGLDMKQYDSDYGSDAVAERVARDREDGTTLGIQGTPTFYINGELFEPESVEDFSAALDEALAE